MSNNTGTLPTTTTTAALEKPLQEANVAAEIEHANNSSTLSISTSAIPYYGSREPKQSAQETDRVIFQMMDGIQISKTAIREKEHDAAIYTQDARLLMAEKPAARHQGILWKFRIIFSSLVILLLVVVTVVVSEIIKKRDRN